jgi:glycosyltransferase involved in cell wall biosynthesis
MSAKKVLMIGWEYPPHHSGGLGVACQGMAHALIDNDVHVCFLLPKTVRLNDTKVPILFADEPVKTTNSKTATEVIAPHLEMLARELQNPYLTSVEYEMRLTTFLKAGGKIVPRTLVEQVEHYGKLTKAMLRERYSDIDVIHAHDWLCFPAGIAAKEATGKPLIAHVHATEFDRGGGTGVNETVYQRERDGMMRADHVIAVSELTKKTIVEKYGIHPDKVTVVHNGKSPMTHGTLSRFAHLQEIKRQGKKIVLFAGRITIQKGVDYFVHAAKRVLEHNKDVYFVVAGSGDMEQQIIALTANLGISHQFLFTGYYTLEEQSALFSLADVVVMPSVSEPFGIIPLESMSNGTPVIVSKQSGVAEVISHALKVDFWDTDETANKILAVLRHHVLKETLQQEGLRQVGGITWDKAAKKMKALYQTIT